MAAKTACRAALPCSQHLACCTIFVLHSSKGVGLTGCTNYLACSPENDYLMDMGAIAILDKLGYIINVTGMVGNVYCFINVNI
jgi:hypothetical protein